MFTIRRTSPEPRMEMTPLIDVVFLLLTFFVFALVLMVRAEVLGVRLPALRAAAAARPGEFITIAIADDGAVHLDGEPVARDGLVERLLAAREAAPDARLLVAADERARAGDLLWLVDELTRAGLGEFGIVGRPRGAEAAPDGTPP